MVKAIISRKQNWLRYVVLGFVAINVLLWIVLYVYFKYFNANFNNEYPYLKIVTYIFMLQQFLSLSLFLLFHKELIATTYFYILLVYNIIQILYIEVFNLYFFNFTYISINLEYSFLFYVYPFIMIYFYIYRKMYIFFRGTEPKLRTKDKLFKVEGTSFFGYLVMISSFLTAVLIVYIN